MTTLSRASLAIWLPLIGATSASTQNADSTTAPMDSLTSSAYTLDLGVTSVVAQGMNRPASEDMRSVTVIQEKELHRQHNQSLTDALRNQPGIEMVTQGPNIAKPSIRGMTNQRVVLVRDGVRHEAQQWSHHHTPEVDISDAQQIEVLRGPASILYGSGALGGVVFVRSPEIETLQQGANPYGGCADYTYYTNSAQHAGHACMHIATEKHALRMDVAGRKAEYYAVPGRSHFLVKQAAGLVTDTVETRYTEFENYNFRIMGGYRYGALQASLTGTQYYEQQTLIGEGHWHNSGGPDGGPWYHVGEPIESPTTHQKVQLNLKNEPSGQTVEMDLAYQHDHRQGIPGSTGVQVDLENHMVSTNLRWSTHYDSHTHRLFGLSASQKWDRTYGVEVLVPDHNTTDAGLFSTYTFDFASTLTTSLGLRGDFRSYTIKPTQMTGGLKPNKALELRGQPVDSIPAIVVQGSAHAVVPSFTSGLTWRSPIEPLTFSFNLGSGFRLPDPNELAILGAHHGSYEYMVGLAIDDPSQSEVTIDNIGRYREIAINTEGIARWKSKLTQSELSLYYNRLFDYIYAQPTGQFVWLSAISALPVKEYTQADAALYGIEYTFRTQFLPKWSVNGLANYTIGRILGPAEDSDGDGKAEPWLPGIAPPHIGGELEYRLPWNIYASTRLDGYFAQTRLAEFENVLRINADGSNEEFRARGYMLLGAAIRWEKLFRGNRIYSSLQGSNLLNKSYTSHLSSYKGIAQDPGFGLSAKIGYEF